MQSIISQQLPAFNKIIDFLITDLAVLRTDRATPGFLESIKINAYETFLPLKQLANISISSSQSLIVQPWDRNLLKDIERGIQTANLGVTTQREGQQLRVNLPPLTEERRQELIKLLHQKGEKAKINIRGIREDIHKTLKQNKEKGVVSEDDFFRIDKELQTVIGDYNNKINDLIQAKEKELITV